MDKIKLVIWDLDETFWKGTLSEEGVEVIEKNIQVVKELTNRGIINSIVSKNDFESAKSKLIEIGVWDYFVFPAVEWKPKGLSVKQIIEDCQLRDTNVLFLDDQHQNLEEAKFYNPNLNVKTPDFIPEILTHHSFIGKDDRSHSRLNQYKLLEKKAVEKSNFNSNQDFLEQSQIKIEKIVNLDNHLDRITELVNRTNQLNFTKVRLNELEIKELLAKNHLQNVALHVKDRYGDYGIIGFYSYNRQTHALEHFVFSCRILNLGIPQFIYAQLGFPKIEIIPEVAEELDSSTPNWIKETKFSTPILAKKDSVEKPRVLFIGGCDYDQLFFYLENNGIEFNLQINFNNSLNFIVRPSHSDFLIAEKNLSKDFIQKILINKKVPFIDEINYNSKVFEADYDCLIFNPRMDYELFVYEHKVERFLAPYGGFNNDWTNPEHHEQIVQTYQKRKVPLIDQPFLKEFSAEFNNLGRISPERFIDNLNEIRRSIPTEKPMIMINCPELNLSFKANGKEVGERFHIMNNALDQFVASHENVHLIDIRKVIDDESKVTTDLGHFQRKYYKEISIELLQLLDRVIEKKLDTELSLKAILGGVFWDVIQFGNKIKRNFKLI